MVCPISAVVNVVSASHKYDQASILGPGVFEKVRLSRNRTYGFYPVLRETRVQHSVCVFGNGFSRSRTLLIIAPQHTSAIGIHVPHCPARITSLMDPYCIRHGHVYIAYSHFPFFLTLQYFGTVYLIALLHCQA